ncbi:hypothetical protein MPH_06093 [Macrophomina phaseolina MS6]|uniref:Uncharacterized protein n=1 Tax=Macrophomina phaseolina (strain MS6) TaxID=1126212 RepID=K2S2B3_MACPH|nr:hypothetical protein MPH_06093 [Macrophomina phaseolina MS6]
MAFYFDDLLTAGDAEQALRYKFSPVDLRPGSARSFYSSSKNSNTPLYSAGSRSKLVKYNARYSTPVVCASWPCKAPRVYEPHRQYRYSYQYNRQGYSYLDL